MAFNNVDWSI